jgi:hypothetical protein
MAMPAVPRERTAGSPVQVDSCCPQHGVWVAYALMLAFVAALASLGLWLLKRGVGLRS